MANDGRAAHPRQHTKIDAGQLARTAGRVVSVKRMIEAGRSCAVVLIQLAAARPAVDRASRLALEDHLESRPRGATTHGPADAEWGVSRRRWTGSSSRSGGEMTTEE